MGLKTDIEHLSVEVAGASPDEAAALELPPASPVTRVSRVLLIDGEAAAWMIDVLPADLVAAGIIRERPFAPFDAAGRAPRRGDSGRVQRGGSGRGAARPGRGRGPVPRTLKQVEPQQSAFRLQERTVGDMTLPIPYPDRNRFRIGREFISCDPAPVAEGGPPSVGKGSIPGLPIPADAAW